MPFSFPQGLVRLFHSSKAWAALGGTVIAFLPIAIPDAGLTPQQRRQLWADFATKSALLWGGVIAVTGLEDASEKWGSSSAGGVNAPAQPPTAPTVQVNAAGGDLAPVQETQLQPTAPGGTTTPAKPLPSVQIGALGPGAAGVPKPKFDFTKAPLPPKKS